MEWHENEQPPQHGYYLGAWRKHDRWVVSELWFNPDSIGTGWWPTRGYLGQDNRGSTETIKVEAWAHIPHYKEPTA